MMMNSRTAKDFSYWGKIRNLRLALELYNKFHNYDCFVIIPDEEDGHLKPFETITEMGTWLN